MKSQMNRRFPHLVRHSQIFKLSEDTYELQVRIFVVALSDFEVVRWHFFSFKINYGSLSRLEHVEKELLFTHHTQPTKQMSILSYINK